MSKFTIFEGAATALVTPLNENGIDFENFGKLIDWQIEQGINALVICGTTGEASTLTDAEHKEAIRFAVERAAHRVPIIAGTGGNDTAYAVELTKYACSVGVDACLIVTPYYNKATQNGLIKMFYTIADASTKPIIVYNIPGRTGVNILPKTFVELAKHPMIAAVKEASGNISQCVKIMQLVGDQMDMYSGNDDQTVPIMSIGGKGVISVLSNVFPKETAEMCRKFLDGDVKGSAEMQLRYLPLIDALFSEVNPIPAKAAMSKLGFGENYVRLPLTPMEEDHAEVLYDEMRKLGLNV
ncbi:MAG: 4-hydroxy-tetrahydrodipicolinate synthase [Clostridia bacterium]|nr:4-hydroxy-tetrahydrodipicolinate synthase [Clostridia bacterium]MBQ2153296.1 4-hydroxy-tetrahydrodipicolinate synthase [Clostridia bacterium]